MLEHMTKPITISASCYAPCRSLAVSEFSKFLLQNYLGPAPIQPNPTLVQSESILDHLGPSGDVAGSFYYLHLSSHTDYCIQLIKCYVLQGLIINQGDYFDPVLPKMVLKTVLLPVTVTIWVQFSGQHYVLPNTWSAIYSTDISTLCMLSIVLHRPHDPYVSL